MGIHSSRRGDGALLDAAPRLRSNSPVRSNNWRISVVIRPFGEAISSMIVK